VTANVCAPATANVCALVTVNVCEPATRLFQDHERKPGSHRAYFESDPRLWSLNLFCKNERFRGVQTKSAMHDDARDASRESGHYFVQISKQQRHLLVSTKRRLIFGCPCVKRNLQTTHGSTTNVCSLSLFQNDHATPHLQTLRPRHIYSLHQARNGTYCVVVSPPFSCQRTVRFASKSFASRVDPTKPSTFEIKENAC
jgi:hypothetical protein